MEKYKICPSCHTKNAPALLECINCEADLTRVKITDEETERMLEANAIANEQEEEIVMVRICDCGAKNPANARKCSVCEEDISDILPTPDKKEEKKETEYVMSSLDGQYAYKFSEGESVIGRESLMSEYLASKSYVSRMHAKIVIENDSIFIENLSNTNFTYVNNIKISNKVELKDGDEVGLGGTNINGKRQDYAAYFLVRIGTCM